MNTTRGSTSYVMLFFFWGSEIGVTGAMFRVLCTTPPPYDNKGLYIGRKQETLTSRQNAVSSGGTFQ